MKDCVGIINLDENEEKMGQLTANRPLASVPIAARYRVIDFVLSNMKNSGINSIAVFGRSKSRSLIDHIGNGMPWDLNRKNEGLRIFNFGKEDPMYNDVQSFSENMKFFNKIRKEYVLLTPSYMICNIDYRDAFKYHKVTERDITVVYKKVNLSENSEDFYGCSTVNMDSSSRVKSIGENVGSSSEININMELYIMKKELFINIVNECISSGLYKKVKSYIHNNLNSLNVGGYEFNGYLNCINSTKSLFESNMQLLNRDVNKEIFNRDRPIYTKTKDEGPTYYSRNSNVKNSIVANGCKIDGEVENCVIGRRVYIGKNAKIKDCIIMQNTKIGDNVILNNVIANKDTEINEEKTLIGSSMYPLILQGIVK